MKRILQNFRKGSGRDEVLGTSDLTGRQHQTNPYGVEEEDDDDTSLYTTSNNPQPQLEVEFNFSEDKKEDDKEFAPFETTPNTAEVSCSPTSSSHQAKAVVESKIPQEQPPPQNITQTVPPPHQYPPDRYAETRDLVKKFIADIWNRGELDLIPSVCSPSLRCNGNNGMFPAKYSRVVSDTSSGFDRIGHDGLARIVKKIRDALDEYHCEIHCK